MTSHSDSNTNGSFEATQTSATLASDRRRLRLEDMTSPEEQRIPLKSEKMARKDSRLALRNLFGRSKSKETLGQFNTSQTGAESPVLPEPTHEITSKASGILRGAFADLSSNWQSSKNAEASLPSPTHAHAPGTRKKDKPKLNIRTKQRPSIVIDTAAATAAAMLHSPILSPTSPPASVPIPRVPTSSHYNQSQPMYKTVKTPIATWDPPPLFRAYPQAIRHNRLPAASVAADSLLRFHEKHGAAEADKESAETVREEGTPTELRKRKSHRHNTSNGLPKFEWTTKIYMLVTSGYLLQYSGDGAYDRLPEKVLHLSKHSVAFATDIFPGKHWVLQVSATMDTEGTMSTDSRSLFSRLLEKRHANNFLMVFENGDDMNAWITVLRREIAAMGGKEMLSETGQARPADSIGADGHQLRAQGSQRALVVRDPVRFSRALAPEQLGAGWPSSKRNSHCSVQSYTSVHSGTSTSNRNSSSDLGVLRSELDDVSTTNSFVSQDGRQLDSLRESNGNRLSVISAASVQRTILTSAGSSPVCLSRRDSFTTNFMPDEMLLNPVNSMAGPGAQRPEKRQSMVSMHSVNSLGEKQRGEYEAQQVVNFSVPNSSGRRFSVTRSPSSDALIKETSLRSQSQRKPLPTLPTLHDSLPAAVAMRSPSHISQCFSPIDSPSSPSYALHSVPSRRSSRAGLETNSLRMVSSPVSTPAATPRRHNSSRMTRTSSFTTMPRPQSIVAKSRTHIAALASPTSLLRLGTSASQITPLKLRSAPPVSMDKLSMSPKKVSASLHPASAAGRERQRSFVLEASEVPAHRYTGAAAPLSPLPLSNESKNLLADAPKLSSKPSLSALLPQRSVKDVPAQPACSVHGGLPAAARL
ncbi:hypothetical protein TD95_001453 [Thielaviopsis punctulata]|uniref:PH domain-containing protein n=1 Tax=Thielaviopsis punctulata TaxID=72032 RepID=A0A0F4ZAM2_9PEZI|nr:hypothetical protein TD95_001453 [Thielaviopsis punctulata]